MKLRVKVFLLIATTLVLTACGSTKVTGLPDVDFPEFPELFITVHREELQDLQQTTVPNRWLNDLGRFYTNYQDLQKRYADEKTKNKNMPEVTFPTPPELVKPVQTNEAKEFDHTPVSDDWLYKLSDFCNQYQALERQYAEKKAEADKGKK